jgi:hypothetical protein
MGIKYEPNELNRIILEKDEDGIFFGALLADSTFMSMDIGALNAEEVLMIAISSIINMIDTISENIDRELAEILYDEAIKGLVIAKQSNLAASNDCKI